MKEITLRDWQKVALERWKASRFGTVEVATGGGKTFFSLVCWKFLLEEDPHTPFVVIVPTQSLADQWFLSAVEEAGLPKSEVTILKSSAKKSDIKKFNIAIINSARKIDPNIWPENRFLVVDECHRAGSPENAKSLRGPSAASLGLSATPERQYDDGFLRYVTPVVGPIIYSYTVAEARADGVLSDFELWNVRILFTEDEQEKFDKLTKKIARAAARLQANGEDSDIGLKGLLMQRSRVSSNASNRIPTAIHLSERHPGARTLIFHESIDGAESICHQLKTRNHSATTYHSKIEDNLRRENLRMFKIGIYDKLVTCRALDEGTNIPETSVAIIAAATASSRQRIQRLGRVLRPAPGKDRAIIYTIYASPQEEDRLREEAKLLGNDVSINWLSMRETVQPKLNSSESSTNPE